jgi:phage shock protein PspC (stress-responsive transcriptional regulator)/predicted membrane protein
MTAEAPPPADGAPRRVTRASSDAVLGGVAAGLARHFGVDVTLVRVAFVVLTLFGGSGLALYAILWLLLPAEDGPPVVGPGASTARKAILIALIVIACLSLPVAGPGLLFAGPGVVLVAIVAALVYLSWRAVGGEGSPALTRAAWLVLAVSGSIVLGVGAGVAAALGAGTVVAIVVIAAGLAMIIGGFVGGARWLAIPALIMAVPLSVVAAANIDLRGGVGERDYRPASMADLDSSYRLGVGELRVDLRDVDLPAARTNLEARVGVGRLALTVPDDVCVQLRSRVGAGQINVFDRPSDGVDVVVERSAAPAAGAPSLTVDARAGVGQIELRHPDGRTGQPACAS